MALLVDAATAGLLPCRLHLIRCRTHDTFGRLKRKGLLCLKARERSMGRRLADSGSRACCFRQLESRRAVAPSANIQCFAKKDADCAAIRLFSSAQWGAKPRADQGSGKGFSLARGACQPRKGSMMTLGRFVAPSRRRPHLHRRMAGGLCGCLGLEPHKARCIDGNCDLVQRHKQDRRPGFADCRCHPGRSCGSIACNRLGRCQAQEAGLACSRKEEHGNRP